ncbi:MAG: CsbD family protein [Polaromonas sp.]|uniref:CsbD family protein n=1 Tax=Polaromonas sp. TaxID=1869339 RepID=UPI002732D76D|nr:CsbD family protein [Polaromonas sp.]MDP2817297.1 CsbD family protein [Polaromonas sp.]
MNKHQVEGRVDEAKGKVKEVAGRVVGNENLKAEGLTDQVKGKAQSGYGDAKEGAKDRAKKAIDKL